MFERWKRCNRDGLGWPSNRSCRVGPCLAAPSVAEALFRVIVISMNGRFCMRKVVNVIELSVLVSDGRCLPASAVTNLTASAW